MSLYLCDIERILTFDDSELKIYLCSPATHYTSISLQQRKEVLCYLFNLAMFHVFASYHQRKIDAVVFNVQILITLIDYYGWLGKHMPNMWKKSVKSLLFNIM